MLVAGIFVVLAVAMIVGPLMMLRPSPRQTQLIKLRRLAVDKGLRVQMLDRPVAGGESLSTQSKPEMVAAYCMQLQMASDSPLSDWRWMLVRTAFAHDIHLGGVWDWSEKQQAPAIDQQSLLVFLQSLPESVLAVRQDGEGIAVLWSERVPREQSPEQAVEVLNRALLQLAALLQAAAKPQH
ncbi:MAG: hypothetical protein KTR17_01115 [Cellvibrionaceae bacterium]|nr:hypothetical protein [Cellvibrionaceae bacterium]